MTEYVKNGYVSLKDSIAKMFIAAGDEAPAMKRSLVFLGAAALVEGLALSCFFPIFHALLTEPMSVNALMFWLSIMAGLAVLEGVLRWFGNGAFSYSPRFANVSYLLRLKLGNTLRHIPLETLYKKSTGELVSVLSGNVDEVTMPMGTLSAVMLRSLLVPLVVILLTSVYDWRMALILALIFPLLLPMYRRRRAAYARGMSALADANVRTSAALLEYIQGLAVLRSANATGVKAKVLHEALLHLEKIQRQGQKKGILPNILTASLVEMGIWVIVLLGVIWILQGSLSLSVLMALLVIVVRFSEPVALFINMAAVFDYMEAGLTRIEALLNMEPLPVKEPIQSPKGFDIEFDNVSFSYHQSEELSLQSVSLRVPERSMIALVGPSGSGKTTLFRMLLRYADPQSGKVTLGGCDIRHMEPETLMQQVSVVFQDVYLFNDTIMNNIRMGRPDASDDEVQLAARSAYCEAFIQRLPDGYQTQVGDIGARLSGGEKQRISIARALLKNAPIVLLDEATAALDTESEAMVQSAINALVSEKTVLVIAHRLSTIRQADRIYVFEKGRQVESGSHDELIAQEGCYHRLWQAQESVKAWHLTSCAEEGT